jgi:hypothetical protein
MEGEDESPILLSVSLSGRWMCPKRIEIAKRSYLLRTEIRHAVIQRNIRSDVTSEVSPEGTLLGWRIKLSDRGNQFLFWPSKNGLKRNDPAPMDIGAGHKSP